LTNPPATHDPDPPVVWITGASSGIGAALAREWARRGARVILSARDEERLARVKGACRDPERHMVLRLDLERPDTFPDAVAAVLGACGRVDVMVHNGGISQRSRAEDTGLAVDRRVMEIDYFGTVALTKALLPAMLERGAGRFVVVSSLVGKIGTPLRSGYSAAKHALHGFFESLRAEVHGRGVRVTMVCPGFIRTEVSIHALTADGSEQGSMDRAQERGMSPEACARRVVRAVEAGRAEVLVGGKEVWAVRLARFFPGLYRRLIRRVRVT
jgi:dehydrogenase/reductase SDR family member 7B